MAAVKARLQRLVAGDCPFHPGSPGTLWTLDGGLRWVIKYVAVENVGQGALAWNATMWIHLHDFPFTSNRTLEIAPGNTQNSAAGFLQILAWTNCNIVVNGGDAILFDSNIGNLCRVYISGVEIKGG